MGRMGRPTGSPYASYIDSYSPYDNTRPANYPAILITAGLYDPRQCSRAGEMDSSTKGSAHQRCSSAVQDRDGCRPWRAERSLRGLGRRGPHSDISPRDRDRNDVTHTNAALAASAINAELRATCRQAIGFFDAEPKQAHVGTSSLRMATTIHVVNAKRSPVSTRGMTGTQNRTAVSAPITTSRRGSGLSIQRGTPAEATPSDHDDPTTSFDAPAQTTTPPTTTAEPNPTTSGMAVSMARNRHLHALASNDHADSCLCAAPLIFGFDGIQLIVRTRRIMMKQHQC